MVLAVAILALVLAQAAAHPSITKCNAHTFSKFSDSLANETCGQVTAVNFRMNVFEAAQLASSLGRVPCRARAITLSGVELLGEAFSKLFKGLVRCDSLQSLTLWSNGLEAEAATDIVQVCACIPSRHLFAREFKAKNLSSNLRLTENDLQAR